MRDYSEDIAKEITNELNIIWQAHQRHKLEGQMRLYTTDKAGSWESHQKGLELWFGSKDVDEVVEKILTFYRKGTKPNTTFLLDPIVYKRGDSPVPMPVGTGVIWCTVITRGNEQVTSEAAARVHSLGLRAGYLKKEGNDRAGLKVFGLLNKPIVPNKTDYNQEGTIVKGCREIYDLIDMETPGDLWKNYVLSGLQYENEHGIYQHEKLTNLFGGANCSSLEHTGERPIGMDKVMDAAVCWNAYDRIPALFERYGIDVANLDKNLESKRAIDLMIDSIKQELLLIWLAHKVHGLKGEMRIYSEKSQEIWRSKQGGFEFWFGPNEMDKAIEYIKHFYSGGLLPNSPLLLDPMLYKKEGNRRVPVGSGIVWATALCLGRKKYTHDMRKRMQDIGVFSSEIDRGGIGDSGIKILGFVDKPVLPEEAKQAAQGCFELFDVADANGKQYWPYYLLSGLEYLCGHGTFSQAKFAEMFPDRKIPDEAIIRKNLMPLKRIKDAAVCWNGYDRYHRLWNHFGIDAENLQDNMKYFNMVARDFELLDATTAFEDEESIKLESETFSFVANGWIPKGAVTLIAASGGTGKSSAAHNLCVKASIDYHSDEPPPMWLGSPMNPDNCQGMCVYFSGEDGPAIVNERAKLFDPEGRSRRLMFQRVNFGEDEAGQKADIGKFLERLKKMPQVPIVVIDPARKYLKGDEDDSDVVSEFFEAIENFAVEKNTAMVVVHHLQKGAKPKSSEDVLFELRGSQVFIDRPRVIIGMSRQDKYTIAGLSKCNIPPSLGMVQGDRVFVRNPKTLELEWLPGAEGIRGNAFISSDELKQLQEDAEEKKRKSG